MAIENREISIRRAIAADVSAVTTCVNDAYQHYIERIGQRPGPMREDYNQVIAECEVFIAQLDQQIIGVLVLSETDEGFLLNNVAVHPAYQGQGIGRRLLELAESRARLAGYTSVYLYTHEKMTENQSLYTRIGYVEYERRTEMGLTRVFMRKALS